MRMTVWKFSFCSLYFQQWLLFLERTLIWFKNVSSVKKPPISNADLNWNAKYCLHKIVKFTILTLQTFFITVRKTIFRRFWNIIRSSKRQCKYHLSINFLAVKKTLFSITKKFKTRSFPESVSIIFQWTFWVKKRPYFPFPKNLKEERFCNQ